MVIFTEELCVNKYGYYLLEPGGVRNIKQSCASWLGGVEIPLKAFTYKSKRLIPKLTRLTKEKILTFM